MNVSIPVILFLVFACCGLAISIVFWYKKDGSSRRNKILAAYLFLSSLEMTNHCLRWSGIMFQPGWIHWYMTHFPMWLLYGPLLILYLYEVLYDSSQTWKKYLLFLPSFIIFLLISPFYFLGGEEKLEVVMSYEVYKHAFWHDDFIWIVILVMVLYGLYAFKVYTRSKQRFSYKVGIWLRCLLASYYGFVLSFSIYIFLVYFKLLDPSYDYFADTAIVFFICLLAYYGFIQPDLFSGVKSLEDLVPFVKYKKTGMTFERSQILKRKLQKAMNEDKLFLESDLRLNDLAKYIKASRNHTSQVINEGFDLSFFDFINQYRVDHACDILIKGEQDISVSEMAYAVGFNSRASFYKAFKKFKGMTPNELKMKNNGK